jgi:nucleoside-diphosphate-sugar epimerase
LNENKESGIETSWLRIFQPYGITQDRSRLIPMLIYKLMNQHKVTIDNPNSERDWISVDDIAKAVIWIIEKRIIGSIDVGTSVGTKTKEIVKLLAALMNVSYENVRLNLNNSQPDSLVASPESKLFKANWRPRANFETEIEKIIHSKKQLF